MYYRNYYNISAKLDGEIGSLTIRTGGRVGGEPDKFGNLFEGAWTIHHLLLVLAGSAKTITVEDIGELSIGSEFTLATLDHGDEMHQVKRQAGTNNGWTLRRLNDEDVLEAARHHVELGREFHFVSTIPAPKLKLLADRARRSADLQAFLAHWLTEELKGEFTYLSGTVYKSDQTAWKVLRGVWTRSIDELGLRRMNDALAAAYLEGAPPTAAALSLGDLAQQNLGLTLDIAAIEQRLGAYELRRAQAPGNATARQTVAEASERWKRSVERTLLHPSIPRDDAPRLAEALLQGKHQVAVVLGAAGTGKSAVLHQAVQALEAEHWTVLGFRIDRLRNFTSTGTLGEELELGRSPVAALAAVAGAKPCLLVVDQMDAVSAVSGRNPEGFDTVADIVQEAAAFPQMRVLLACRTFDADNDDRIRRFLDPDRVTRVEVPLLSGREVDEVVASMGVDPDRLTAQQRGFLATPFNLVLFSAIAGQPDALSFTSVSGLLSAYWNQKRQDCENRQHRRVRFAAVIETLANSMSECRGLTARLSVLDAADLGGDAEVLASEHVLVQDGNRYAFFHESFFDYAFGRLWTERGQSLVDFLLADEQELFRRGQVRQILLYIRGDEPERFVREAEAVLAHPEVRFHIKAVVLTVVRSLADPSQAEWQMIERLLSDAA